MSRRPAALAATALALALFGAGAAPALVAAPASALTCSSTTWSEGPTYTAGQKVTYQGRLYTALVTHTAWAGTGWNPAATPSLWTDNGACTGSGSTPTPTPTTPRPTPTTTTPPPTTPGKLAGAPYLYLGWGNPPSATSIMSQTGVKGFTMAFMLSSGGCTPAWDGQRPLTGGTDAATIAAIKNAGGQVQISFGGWQGNKLGPACASSAAFAGAVQQVINAYQPTVVDFDIENTDELENYTVQDRILGSFAQIKANNPNVKIVVTIPTTQSGPGGAGARLIQRAAAIGAPIDNFTIMTFDFGASNIATATTSAAEGLKNQLKAAYGWTDAQAYAHMGISGMNGLSDQSEVTSTAAWTTIRDYARSKGLTRLAFWSVNRDRACATPGVVSSDCSGIAQTSWEFTRITAGF